MQRTCKYLTLSTDHQRFLYDVLADPNTPYTDDCLDNGLLRIFQHVREESKQIIKFSFEDVETEFLEIRYYSSPNDSEIMKRLRLENENDKRPDSDVLELSFKHKTSFLSNISEHQISEFDEPSRCKRKEFSEERDTWDSSPILHTIGKQRRNKAYSITQLITYFEEIVLVYLQLVNLLIKVQKNNLSKLAVYSFLWRKYVLSVIELDQTFASLNDCINDIMSNRMPEYPLHPNYSIWRLMVNRL